MAKRKSKPPETKPKPARPIGKPAARPPPDPELLAGKIVEKYKRERDRFEKLATTVDRHLRAGLRAAAIPSMLTGRTKDPDSLREKLLRGEIKTPLARIADLDELTNSLGDLAGVRVLVYREEHVLEAVAVVERSFEVRPPRKHFNGRVEAGSDNKSEGYRAHHRVIALRAETIEADPTLSNLEDVTCEVQITRLVDHVWNEAEHDIKYKIPKGQPSAVQLQLLKSLRTNLEAVTSTLVDLESHTKKQWSQNALPLVTPDELRRGLQSRFDRVLRGDFASLLKLLSVVLPDEVTLAALDKLKLIEKFDAALKKLGPALGSDVDDVIVIVSQLLPQHGPELLKVVRSWRGRPNSVRAFVEAKAGSD